MESDAGMAPGDRLDPVLSLVERDEAAALAGLDDLIGLYPEDPRLPFLQGSVLAGLERYSEARTAMQKAVDIAPGFAIARFQLAFLLLTSGDAGGARSTWAPLLDLPEDHPLRLFVDGLEAMVADRFPEAIALIESGMQRNTDLPPLNRNMAILIQEMRDRLGGQESENDVESGVHFLLKQSSLKETRH
jgi:tetratricopeptide (TPR) repeat protein